MLFSKTTRDVYLLAQPSDSCTTPLLFGQQPSYLYLVAYCSLYVSVDHKLGLYINFYKVSVSKHMSHRVQYRLLNYERFK